MKRTVISAALTALFGIAISGAALAAPSKIEADLAVQAQQMDSTATTQGQGVVTGKIAGDFEAFAGSRQNAEALVTGLRSGSEITLTGDTAQPGGTATPTELTFTPETGKMGYGNVYTTLSLAKAELAGLGITNPTPEQIQAALSGGTITVNGTSTTLNSGILDMRASGMGWGEIAHSLGYKLGHVISAMKSANATMGTATGTTTGGVTTASGTVAQPGKGKAGATTSSGKSSGGIVKGDGHGHGKGGIVTATGSAAGGVAASGLSKGGGIQNAGGQGNGKALGHNK